MCSLQQLPCIAAGPTSACMCTISLCIGGEHYSLAGEAKRLV